MKRDKYRARAIKIMREAESIVEPNRQLVILTYAQCWLRLAVDTDESTPWLHGDAGEVAPKLTMRG